MLSTVEIRNWRCIEDLILPLDPLTALVGPNGAGKTAVLDAIDFVLGTRWPAMGYLNIPQDFFALDTSRDLSIRCTFDHPYLHTDSVSKDHEIMSLEYRCRPYKRKTGSSEAGDLHDEFLPLTSAGDTPMVATKGVRKGLPPEFAPLIRVSKDMRSHGQVLTINDRRTVAAHGPARRGSVLTALLATVRHDFAKDVGGARSAFRESYDETLSRLRTSTVKEIEASIADTSKRMLGFLGSGTVKDLDISFGFADPANPFSALTLMCREGDVVLPAEAMSLGIQSAIVVGIFDALRQQNNSIGTVLIEEPEMYLHPQAQRFFHSLLAEMAETGQCQVIYTTHSPIFADMTRFSSIRLLQKPTNGATELHFVDKPDDQKYLQEQEERQKLAQYMDPASGEALFARRVLLVEGHGDRLAVEFVARQRGVDLDAEGLSVVACGGKGAIPFFARMCRSLEIPTLVLHDEDVYSSGELKGWQVEENKTAPSKNQAIAEALGDTSKIFLVKPTLEEALGVGRSASDKPRRVVEALETCGEDDLPEALTRAVDALVEGA